MTSTVNNWWLSLQHDWYDGFANEEKVWVSAHRLNSATHHSYLNPTGPTDDLFTSNLISKRELEVLHKDSGTTTRFTAPVHSHSVTPNNNPVSLDLTSSNALGAVSDGKDVLVFEAQTGTVRRTLSGHVAGVETVKFFPSDKVLLTGGEDMQIRIWSVEDGSCPVTLTGHKRSVTCLDMIDRGKEVVSGSRDGTIKVWICGTQECITTLSLHGGSVNNIQVFNHPESTSLDRLVMSATETGLLSLHNLQDTKLVSQYQHSSELTTCTAYSGNLLVAGSSTGEIITLDIRNFSKPTSIHKRSNYAITSLSCNGNRLWCGQKDGECYSIVPDTTLKCDTTLSGGECEAIYCVVANRDVVTTAAKDRKVRRYEV